MHRHGGWVVLHPRGPRSDPSYSVSDRHHLIDPIRPTRGHIAYKSLSGPRVVPGFRWLFRLDMPSSVTPGSSIIVVVQFSDVDIGIRRDLSGSAIPKFPQSASRGARISG